MESQIKNHWNVYLPTNNGETSIAIPIYPGSRRVIIKSSDVPFFIGEKVSTGSTNINSIDKRDFVYEIKKCGHLIIKKSDIYKSLNIEIEFI